MRLSLNIQTVLIGITYLISFFALIGILWVMLAYRKKRNVGKKDLKSIFIGLIFFLLFLLSIIIVIGFFILFTSLREVLLIAFILLILFFLLMIWTSYNLLKLSLFKLEFKKDILNKSAILFLIAIMCITLLFVSLYTPFFHLNKIDNQEYIIINPDNPLLRTTYLSVKIPVDITSFGVISTIIPLIPINFESLNLETEGAAADNFRIKLNLSDDAYLKDLITNIQDIKNYNEKSINKHSFTEIKLDKTKGVLTLIFNPLTIKDEQIKQIVLFGYIKNNISKSNYSYSDNSNYQESCNSKNCNFTFNITNNLNLPTRQKAKYLVNLKNSNIQNLSTCHFINNITYDLPNKESNLQFEPSCKEDYCEFDLRDQNTSQLVFNMYLIIDKDRVVILDHIDINRPIKLGTTFTIEC